MVTPEELHRGASIFRTLRIKTTNRVGVLAHVLAIVAQHGASLGDIRTVSISPLHRIRDIDMGFGDEAAVEATVAAINACGDAEVLEVRDEVLELHVGGKLVVRSRYPIETEADLGRVYTPGVGEVARKIAADPELAAHYTIRANTVAIVSDGSAVLGLGRLGPLAALPILEGKAALLSRLVGVFGIPIALNTSDPLAMAEVTAAISPSFGLVQIEDVAAPACFKFEEELTARGVPAFHDDQHGTAAVVLGALMNALTLTERSPNDVELGCIGLGAAGNAIGRMAMRWLERPVWGADISQEALERFEREGGRPATLEEVMARCDVVIATTGKAGLIPPSSVRQGQIIFALSNPYPEIEVSAARAAGAALATDGRATNNLLAFPGLCRGGLDCGIERFVPAVFLAAARTIAEQAPAGMLLPSPLDPAVHRAVARAVAFAAAESGVASRPVDEDYLLEEPRAVAATQS